jgi:hypothetical protein
MNERPNVSLNPDAPGGDLHTGYLHFGFLRYW